MHVRKAIAGPGPAWGGIAVLAAWTVLGSCAAHAAVIYKWTDAAGVVHYSDQAVPGAEKIVTSGPVANGISAGPSRPPPAASNREPPPAASPRLSIDSPSNQQVFFGDDTVPVRLRLEPPLKPGQVVKWRLNGKALDDQAPDAVAFSLPPLPRGTYTLDATVTDLPSGASQTADSVSFNVRQPSELSPQHKRP